MRQFSITGCSKMVLSCAVGRCHVRQTWQQRKGRETTEKETAQKSTILYALSLHMSPMLNLLGIRRRPVLCVIHVVIEVSSVDLIVPFEWDFFMTCNNIFKSCIFERCCTFDHRMCCRYLPSCYSTFMLCSQSVSVNDLALCVRIILFSTESFVHSLSWALPVANNPATVSSPIYIFLKIIGDSLDVSHYFLKPEPRPSAFLEENGEWGVQRGVLNCMVVTMFLFCFFLKPQMTHISLWKDKPSVKGRGRCLGPCERSGGITYQRSGMKGGGVRIEKEMGGGATLIH